MKPVIRWNLWQRKWSIFWWSFSCIILIAMIILVYPTFRDQAATLDASLSQLPDTAKSLFTDTADFLSPEGYLSSQLFYLFLPLLFSILTIGLGSSLINREEQNGTLELLLSRPLSRSRLLAGKALSGLIVLGIVGLVSLLTTVICAQAVNIGIPSSRLALAVLLSAILSLLFGAIAFALTALGRAGRAVSIAVASFIAIGSYLISSLAGSVHWLHWPAKLLPYHYYQPAEVMAGSFNWWNALGLLIVTGLLFGVALVGFRRRDIG